MPANDLPLAAVPDNSDAARIAALEAQLQSVSRQLLGAGGQVGDWVYTSAVPLNWNTPGTLILVGSRMVPNGVSISRADFPDLFALYNSLGLPFGTGDGSTTFGTPDLLSRVAVSVGTNANAALNDDDGLALASRDPVIALPSSTGGSSAANTGSESAHTHSFTPNSTPPTVPAGGSGTYADDSAATTGAGSSHSHTMSHTHTLSGGGAMPYKIAGLWMLVVLP